MSTTLMIAVAVLSLSVIVVFSLPACRRSELGGSRWDGARNIYRDQLAQLATDRQSGLISAEDVEAAELEIARTVLATKRSGSVGVPPAATAFGALFSIGAAVVIVAGTWVLYAQIGSPDMPDQPLSTRASPASPASPTLHSEHEGTEMSAAIAALATRLENDPDDTMGWQLLGRSYSAIGAYGQAARAYERLVTLAPGDPQALADLGESLVRADKGLVGSDSAARFSDVLEHDPKNPRARYYLALRDAQAGNADAAVAAWTLILRDAPADAPYLPAIRQIIAATVEDADLSPALAAETAATPAAPGPSTDDIAAASRMTSDEKLTMIRGMIARLEARLQEESGDVDGWLRLAKSLSVLGENERVAEVLKTARTANPDDARLTEATSALLTQSTVETDAMLAAPRPSADDIAAASRMTSDEQLSMVRGMVARLEARLQEEPGNVDGWLRLSRSLTVLGEVERAVEVLETALSANPDEARLTEALKQSQR